MGTLTTAIGLIAFTIAIVTLEVRGSHYNTQRFDGYYNNLAHPSWGSKGSHIANVFPVSYVDGTYKIGEDPNPREVSKSLFRRPLEEEEPHERLNALFAYFGQMVADEIVDVSQPTCPREIHGIKIEADMDPVFTSGLLMPYERKEYDKKTGLSVGNPRKQINTVSSWIDGSSIYGNSEVWCDALRSFKDGRLKADETTGFPTPNVFGLPLENLPIMGDDGKMGIQDPTKLWGIGNAHGHENPPLLTLSIMWMKYHNQVAGLIQASDDSLSDQAIFDRARGVVISSLQKIIFEQWLPALLAEPDFAANNVYKYDSTASPEVMSLYATSVKSWFKTLIPATYYAITAENVCSKRRLCNTFFNGQKLISEQGINGTRDIINGLKHQPAAKGNQYLAPDFVDYYHGPLHYSRVDFGAVGILEGRDFGLSSLYEAYPYYTNEKLEGDQFEALIKALDISSENRDKLIDLYPGGNSTKIDPLVLIMLEGSQSVGTSPHKFTKSIIKEQFLRLRNGDRHWYENPAQISYRNPFDQDLIVAATLQKIATDVLGYDALLSEPFNLPATPLSCVTEELEQCSKMTSFDYFAGHEASFIVSWIWIFSVPFAVIGIAYSLFRYRQRKANKANKQNRKRLVEYTELKDTHKHMAYDWNNKDDAKPVQVFLCPQKIAIHIQTVGGKPLRCVDMGPYDTITAFHSSSTKFYFHLFVPKEYDLVLQFDELDEKMEFVTEFRQFLSKNKKLMVMSEVSFKHIEQKAVTKAKRKQILDKFFRRVFAQALNVSYQEEDTSAFQDFQSTIECEVTRDEFADALGLKPNSDFVKRMFAVADTEGRGFLRFREILELVIMLGKGSGASKFQLLFNMFDINKDGRLNHHEVNVLVRSMLDMANSKLESGQLDQLVNEMYESAELTGVDELNFDQFQQLMTGNGDNMMENVSIEWKYGKTPRGKKPPKKKAAAKGKGKGADTKKTIVPHNLSDITESEEIPKPRQRQRGGANGIEEKSGAQRGRSKSLALSSRPQIQTKTSKLDEFIHYFENTKSELGIIFLFYAICAFLFSERFYFYSVSLEHIGARRVLGYGVSFARGAAECISFTFSILLLTMCYNMIRYVRETFLNLYIPFDKNIVFHKLVAWTALFFTVVHVVAYAFNYYHLTASPAGNLCFFDELLPLSSDTLISFDGLLYKSLAGITGVLIICVISVMYVFATQTARRFMHTAFWTTHKLFIVFYILALLHGLLRLTQSPSFYLYFVGPAVLFCIDKLISVSRRKVKLAVLKADLLPSNVTRVVFKRPPNFEYKSGMWVRVAVDALGESEYHPFTLTSSPHEDFLSLHIRAVGPWTKNVRSLLDPDNGNPSPSVYVDGPFGSGQQDWYNFEVAVFVGAGIGVTPYSSILKDFVNMMRTRNRFKIKCQKVYFIWSTASQRNFEWLIDILRQVEDVDVNNTVAINIFITQFFQKFDLRTTMLYVFEEHSKHMGGKSLFTGLRANTNFGRPDFNEIFHKVNAEHPTVKKVGVFSCGPQGVTKGVEKGCIQASSETPALFQHHYENF